MDAWLVAACSVGTVLVSVVTSWFTAKTRTEKLSALAQTVNAIPTAWAEVRKANPNIPNALLVEQVLRGAAEFASRALTEAEKSKARGEVSKQAPSEALLSVVGAVVAADPAALAKRVAIDIAKGTTLGAGGATKPGK